MILADPKNQSDWLTARHKGIGGSDAACVVGKNKYKSNLQLWREKQGLVSLPDISGKPAVAYGKAAEEHIREMFKLDYPEFKVDYHEFRMYANDDYPFIFATLDGKITDKTNGYRGILEIKTATIQNSVQWNDWGDDVVPQNYFVQILHQLAATGWDFAILRAYIRYHKNGRLYAAVKDYRIDRTDVKEDIEFLIEKELEFWQSLQTGKEPAEILPEI